MFSNAKVGSNKTTFQNLIDMVINIGLIALVGASIVAALAIGGAPMSTGDTQAAMPPPEFQSKFDQRVVRPHATSPDVGQSPRVPQWRRSSHSAAGEFRLGGADFTPLWEG